MCFVMIAESRKLEYLPTYCLFEIYRVINKKTNQECTFCFIETSLLA
jgi:hypothetical protein